MEMGTHDPALTPDVGRPRTVEDDMAMRGEVPPGWIRLPGGAILPPNLAGRINADPLAWGGDRDSGEPARIAATRKAMADAVTEYRVAKERLDVRAAAGFGDLVAETMNVLSRAEGMAVAWQAFSDATGGPA